MTPAELESYGLLRVRDAARLLAISETTVRKLLDEEILPSVKILGARRIPRAAVLEAASGGLMKK